LSWRTFRLVAQQVPHASPLRKGIALDIKHKPVAGPAFVPLRPLVKVEQASPSSDAGAGCRAVTRARSRAPDVARGRRGRLSRLAHRDLTRLRPPVAPSRWLRHRPSRLAPDHATRRPPQPAQRHEPVGPEPRIRPQTLRPMQACKFIAGHGPMASED
jgi:hypothetical protein